MKNLIKCAKFLISNQFKACAEGLVNDHSPQVVNKQQFESMHT